MVAGLNTNYELVIKSSKVINAKPPEEKNMNAQKIVLAFLLSIAFVLNYGCGFLVGAAAGGAGGYILRDQGYEVQSPVEGDVEVQSPVKKE